jgi:hypothetical protein
MEPSCALLTVRHVDSLRNWALGTLVVFILALIVGGFLLAMICLFVSAEIALVLWTPLRGWLGIPERRTRKPRPRVKVAEQGLDP